jgi:hypothetical protein
MIIILKKIIGALLLLFGSFFFVTLTGDISSDIRIAGPMNMWPPPYWVYLVLDVLFVSVAFIGIKLLGLSRSGLGYLLAAVGVVLFAKVVLNHINASATEGATDGRYISAPVESYMIVYLVAALSISTGIYLIIRNVRSRRLP